MVMETLQIRLPKAQIEILDSMVSRGLYSSRSDAVRDAVRDTVQKQLWAAQVGTIKSKRDSVVEIRRLRQKLSAADLSLERMKASADALVEKQRRTAARRR